MDERLIDELIAKYQRRIEDFESDSALWNPFMLGVAIWMYRMVVQDLTALKEEEKKCKHKDYLEDWDWRHCKDCQVSWRISD